MTTPGQSAPSGAFQLGSVDSAQGMTEPWIRNTLKAGAVGASGSYTNVQDAINTEIKVPHTNLVNTVELLASGAQLASFFSNGTWTKPLGATTVDFVAVAGGGAGGSGGGTLGLTGQGGGIGGVTRLTLMASEVPSSVSVTIGAGGSPVAHNSGSNGGDGGHVVFGSVFTAFGGRGGVSRVAMSTPVTTASPGGGTETYFASNVGGGMGGSGPGSGATHPNPISGSAGPFSQGGNAGTAGSRNGSPGSSPSPTSLLGAGSSGGGGYYINNGTAGTGGAGGFPGGAGGGGGCFQSSGASGAGGPGGGGALYVITHFS